MDPVLTVLLGMQLGISAGTIIVVWNLSGRVRNIPDVASMEQHVNALRTEVADLVEKYETQARRASTARAREAKADQAQPVVGDDKIALRRLVGQIQLNRRK